jgi:hemerythrin-like domain-containing protein
VKRAEALRPLSRDHHAALVAAKALRDATEPEPARLAFLEFWREHGSHHFRVEEEVLLPGWALHAEVDRPAVARMLEDHLAIRREALRLEARTVPLEELQELGRRLADHVRFEERELFELIEEALDPEALDRLATAIEEAERAG